MRRLFCAPVISIALVLILSFQFSLQLSQASPAPGRSPATSEATFPSLSAQTTAASEIADLIVAPVDSNWDPSSLLRSRPLILDWTTNSAFQIGAAPTPLTYDDARLELEQFLRLRNMAPGEIQRILGRFDDPTVRQIVSAHSLRAALLMLSNFDPYQAVVDSILNGANETGLPFATVEFTDLGVENAVATIQPPSAETGGRFRLMISAYFSGEPPIQLVPALVHESLHGDGENSGPEELAANILDTVAYGELLLVDPGAAYDSTELTAYNNLQLYALLNSMGSRGGGQVGISNSAIGDVFVGPGLEDFDARSIRDSILQDPFYGSLGAAASPISPTAAALIDRLPGQTSLGNTPHFDEELLAMIDRGVSHVITPDVALELAVTLRLNATVASSEVAGTVSQATVLDLVDRPLIPLQPDYFDYNESHRPKNVTDDRSVRLALSEALAAASVPSATRTELVTLFDDPEIRARISESQLRAAVMFLSAIEPWSEIANTLLRSRPGEPTWTVAFAPLPTPVSARFATDDEGSPAILINEILIGESIEVIASALIEGILLESDRQSPNVAVVAALMSTVAWAQFVENRPEIVSSATWGTISRNLDLVALLNSTQWSAATDAVPADALGFLAPASGSSDVLTGLIVDAASFQDWVFDSARVEGIDDVTASFPSELLVGLTEISGIQLPQGPTGPIIDQTALLQLDGRVSSLLPAETIATVLGALMLGTIS